MVFTEEYCQGNRKNYESAALNTLLEWFYAEIKNKQGEDYEPESLKVMATLLDRHLKNKGFSLSIVCDKEFSSSKQVDGEAKQLRLAGRGKGSVEGRNTTKWD